MSDWLFKWIRGSEEDELNFEGVKFGWARINLHYSLQDDDLEYIFKALEFVAEHGYKFLQNYIFQPHSGAWSHINEDEMSK